MQSVPQKTIFIRNFVFGVEDGLVSTVGFLSGIAVADVPEKTIFLTGIILVFVEAVSMAAGSFLSEDFTEDYVSKKEVPLHDPIMAGVIMFLSYFVAGMIPIIPYIVSPPSTAFITSIVVTLLALLVLGIATARISKVNVFKNSIRLLIIAGLAITVGIVVGKAISNLA